MSSSYYYQLAAQAEADARAAQGTINTLTPQLQHKQDQLRIAQEVQGKVSALNGDNSTIDSSLSTLASAFSSDFNDDGANGGIHNLNSTFGGKIGDASQACADLITKLTNEINALQASINNAISTRDSSYSAAASYRSTAAAEARAEAEAAQKAAEDAAKAANSNS